MRLPPDSTDRCSFCDSPATAVWGANAEPVVYVCEDCALDLMPKLAADAVVLTSTTDVDELNRKAATVHETFLEAMVTRLRRELQA